MNREIKFRAWDKEFKYMRDWGGLQNISYGGNRLNGGEVEDSIFNDPELELMQFTGLKDKNGKEIYEGDIVQCKYGYFKPRVWNEAVEYDDGYAGFQPFCEPVDYDEVYLSDYEIIGNIFENKELLNGK